MQKDRMPLPPEFIATVQRIFGDRGREWLPRLPGSLPAKRREKLLRERVGILSAELGTSSETVAASGLVDCVLSHCWGFEDSELGDDWPVGIELARVLCDMAGTS